MGKFIVLLSLLWCVFGCGKERQNVKETEEYPCIFPDYQRVTIPVNIAPLNFKVENASRIEVEYWKDQSLLLKYAGTEKTDIPIRKWRKILAQSKGGNLSVKVFAYTNRQWVGYKPFEIQVVADSIDPYLAYRLIEPGYELGKRLGLYQRHLATFDEKAFMPPALIENSCVNCHAFCNHSPDRFMFHVRWENGGTVIAESGRVQKINTKTDAVITPGAYRMWHPSGKYIAFSNNKTSQAFHALQEKKIEVYDLESDLMIYDVVRNKVLTDQRFTTQESWETFPAWSPDGKYLYFCRATPGAMPSEYKSLKYELCRTTFDEQTGLLGDSIEKIYIPEVEQKSIVFPTLSPDGKYILYTYSESGTFPIWHKDADLGMFSLEQAQTVDVRTINSDETDSYHGWSSSGRWIVFSSRRINGLYTHLYFTYFDQNGHIHKPFLLPQKDPDYYVLTLKSFNIPEFIKGPITVSPYELEEAIRGKAQNAL